jgi:hypothetical protein
MSVATGGSGAAAALQVANEHVLDQGLVADLLPAGFRLQLGQHDRFDADRDGPTARVTEGGRPMRTRRRSTIRSSCPSVSSGMSERSIAESGGCIARLLAPGRRARADKVEDFDIGRTSVRGAGDDDDHAATHSAEQMAPPLVRGVHDVIIVEKAWIIERRRRRRERDAVLALVRESLGRVQGGPATH